MSSSTPNLCFNSSCKDLSDNWRRGWRRRTGDYAHLCDRCATAYEDGKFCETFHLNASGWRCCESCGKQIHCGCIVSFHMFVLLDAGGIECLTCAKKSYILTPNPAWPPPSHFLPSQPEKMELSAKSWSAVAGSGLMPWHQAPNLFNGSDTQSNVHKKMPFEINGSGSIDRYRVGDRLSSISLEMKQQRYERLVPGKLRLGSSETPQNGNSGINMREQSYAFINDFKPVLRKNDSCSSNLSLATASSSRIEADETQLCATLSQPQGCPIPVGKQVNHIGMDSPCEVHIRNGKARGRNQLLTRYRPQITNEELQQISSDSKSVITPLFEKMLSASDAGRIGRLVLPKKCAEAYFPPITQPEGLPLKVQDMKGKEWVFQFRFWPNNNSRMYVLEGITPCIQSLQLQAGDVVTFSRLQPEGKLVMGGRKASAILSSDQGEEAPIMGSEASTPGGSSARNNYGDVISGNGHMKEKILEDSPLSLKRKNGNIGVKNKRLKLDNEDVTVLKLTLKEAQELMRPPANIVPSLVVVEGCEFEEFEEASPVIGRPTIPAVDQFGEKIQWLQCEDCFKWRKVPGDALLASRWTCAENEWDIDKSRCSATEELTKEQLDHMLLTMSEDSSKKEDITSVDLDMDMLVSPEGLDTLANLAIEEEGDGSHTDNRTKHPHHKHGCPCIMCLQLPSGKGSKHKQSCECVVCSSLRLRFKTLMERKEKKQSETEAEPSLPNFQQLIGKVQDVNAYPGTSTLNKDGSKLTKSPPLLTFGQLIGKVQDVNTYPGTGTSTSTLNKDGSKLTKSLHSPLKGQIDLNIQPEREEELSPRSDPGHMDYMLPGPAGRFYRQQGSVGSDVIGDLIGKQIQQDGIGGGGAGYISCVALDRGNQKTV